MAEINNNAEEKDVTSLPETAPADKAKKVKKVEKKPNFLVRAGRGIGKFFRDTASELRKVVWMPKNDVKKNTILVVVSVVVFATVIGIIDFAGAKLVGLLAGLWK